MWSGLRGNDVMYSHGHVTRPHRLCVSLVHYTEFVLYAPIATTFPIVILGPLSPSDGSQCDP